MYVYAICSNWFFIIHTHIYVLDLMSSIIIILQGKKTQLYDKLNHYIINNVIYKRRKIVM